MNVLTEGDNTCTIVPQRQEWAPCERHVCYRLGSLLPHTEMFKCQVSMQETYWQFNLYHERPDRLRQFAVSTHRNVTPLSLPAQLCCELVFSQNYVNHLTRALSTLTEWRLHDSWCECVSEPFKYERISSSKYWVLSIDEASSFVFTFHFVIKEYTFKAIKYVLEHWKYVQCWLSYQLHSESSELFRSSAFQNFLRNLGIQYPLLSFTRFLKHILVEGGNRFIVHVTKVVLNTARIDHTYLEHVFSKATEKYNDIQHNSSRYTPFAIFYRKTVPRGIFALMAKQDLWHWAVTVGAKYPMLHSLFTSWQD